MGNSLQTINKKMKLRSRFYVFIILIVFSITDQPGAIENKSHRITVIVSSDIDIYAQGLAGLQTVVTQKLDIVYLDTIGDEPDKLISSNRPDLIVAIGQKAAAISLKSFPEIPVVISMVNSPRFLGVDRDLCGVRLNVPVESFFKTLKEIRPEARNVYSFYSTDTGAYTAHEGVYFDFQNQLIYKHKKVDSASDIKDFLKKNKKPLDAIYIISDPIYDQKLFSWLSEFAISNQIILMSSFPSLIRLGANFGFSPNYSNIGIKTGEIIHQILNKEDTCRSIGIHTPGKHGLLFYLNKSYSLKSGMVLPETIVNRAELSRLSQAGIGLYQKGKLQSSRSVFEFIRKKDAKNYIANFYLELILNQLTGAKMNTLLNAASTSYEKKDFSQAIIYYNQALSLNPNHYQARIGLKASLREKSESLRQQATKSRASNNNIKAINLYQQSIRTDPGNSKSVLELKQLRTRLYPTIDRKAKSGIADYNNREYKKAIEKFEEVLLISPGHGLSLEYLNLSRKKYNAFQKLLHKK